MSDYERLKALQINTCGWDWSVYDRFQLEREDIELFVPILRKHLFNHTSPERNANQFWVLYDRLMKIIDDPHAPSFKATEDEAKLVQTVLGDYL